MAFRVLVKLYSPPCIICDTRGSKEKWRRESFWFTKLKEAGKFQNLNVDGRCVELVSYASCGVVSPYNNNNNNNWKSRAYYQQSKKDVTLEGKVARIS